jgi:hypothetical protein
MSRFISLRIPGHLLVAVAMLISFEGVSYARTTAQPLRAVTEASAAADGKAAGTASAKDGSAIHSASGDEFARIRICHISKHPRDGVPATEHACPLIIAEADATVSASGVALAN